MEVTIDHIGGTASVDGFTLVEQVDSINGETDIRVWYTEPHVYEDDAEFDLYGDAEITSVEG